MALTIPFGSSGMTLHADLSGAEVLTSHIGELTASDSEDALVLAAMANPIDSKPLEELAAGKKTCTIIISDHTRPVPASTFCPICWPSCAGAIRTSRSPCWLPPASTAPPPKRSWLASWVRTSWTMKPL